MKRVGIVFLCLCLCVGVIGCREEAPQPAQNTTTSATATTTTTVAPAVLSDDALAAVVAPLLGMPDDDSIVYDVQESEYWSAADREVRLVQFFQNGIWCGGAFADPVTGELVHTIVKYFTPTDPSVKPNASLYEQLNIEIHNAYELEQSYPENQSTAGMVALSEKYAAKWAQVAEEYYQKIMAHELEEPSETYGTSEDLHTYVTNMKTAWEAYYAAQCENYEKTLVAIYAGGTIVHPIIADYRYDMQREWALRLVTIYEQL